jgi:hypothetical protein
VFANVNYIGPYLFLCFVGAVFAPNQVVIRLKLPSALKRPPIENQYCAAALIVVSL